MIKWPEKLVEDIARRRCVLFLGSGVSANSINADGDHPKTWIEVLQEGISKLPEDITKKQKDVINRSIKHGDLLLACELLRKYLGPDEYKDLLKSEFFDKHFLTAKIHEEIEQLDSRLVITPNFDQIYEKYVHSIPGNDVVIAKYSDRNIADAIISANRLIIKIHGDITAGDEIIFTKADYAKARNQYAQFYNLLDALLLTNTFIFIGAGLNDPDIQLLLEDYTYRNKYKRKHYFVTPKDCMSADEFAVLEETLSLKFLKYDKKEGHKELTDSIVELHSLVDTKREELSASKDW